MLALQAVPEELLKKDVYVYNKIKANGQHWKKPQPRCSNLCV